MAPEYAMHGYLTDKADVYSFGIVALEIVSGKRNVMHLSNEGAFYLLDWVTFILIFSIVYLNLNVHHSIY